MTVSSSTGIPRQVSAIRMGSVHLDRKFTVDFSYCDGALVMRWSPDVPTGKKLRKLMPAYIVARNTFLTQVSRTLGGAVIIANPDGSISAITGEGVL